MKTLWSAIAAALGLSALSFAYGVRSGAREEPAPAEVALLPEPAEAPPEQVHRFCGSCHAYPPPDAFPRAEWRSQVRLAYDFFRDSEQLGDFPSLEAVVRHYERRAPEELPLLKPIYAATALPWSYQRQGYGLPDGRRHPAVTNVNVGHLFDRRRLDILVCDVRHSLVLALRPYLPAAPWQILGHVQAPGHAEVIDLDGDGIPDVLVADLGNFPSTDDRAGKVIWLRGRGDGTFTPITLLEGVGRVADVQAADFKGTGKLDLVVAVFGWRKTGEILYLDNQTSDWSQPKFVPHVLDERHGTIHVPICDLNKDGRPDFVALISQEHETIVAFLNEGNGRFRKETIYTAPHPAYGSSGIQVVDLNGDGNLDVLYSNGDVLEPPAVLKPYQGVQWLENRGRFPFVPHPLAALYGAERAVAADFGGSGRPDIVAVSYLPGEGFPQRESLNLDAVILLRQTAPGQFARYALEKKVCDHLTCVAGDLFGDGRVHLVTGNHFLTLEHPSADAVTIWSPARHEAAGGATGGMQAATLGTRPGRSGANPSGAAGDARSRGLGP